MRTFAKSQIRYSKSQRMGIFAFLGVLISLQIAGYFLNRKSVDPPEIKIPHEVLLLDDGIQKSSEGVNISKNLKEFDPNELSAEGWQNLGFSAKQVSTIIKYKYSLGGYFKNKEQIRQCYVVSDKKFAEIEPYIKINPIGAKKNDFHSGFSKDSKPKIHYQKFDPNVYGVKDWQRIGFSEKQAETILKYKKILGGKFTTLDQIKKCYVIDEEKFREMKPFIIFPKPKPTGTIELLEEKDSSAVSTIQVLD